MRGELNFYNLASEVRIPLNLNPKYTKDVFTMQIGGKNYMFVV